MHAVIRLRPLPARNALYGAALATAYMDAVGEGIKPPYSALIDLARDIDTRPRRRIRHRRPHPLLANLTPLRPADRTDGRGQAGERSLGLLWTWPTPACCRLSIRRARGRVETAGAMAL